MSKGYLLINSDNTVGPVQGLKLPVSTKTSNYTITVNDHFIFVDSAAGAVIVTLPTAVGNAGLIFVIKKVGVSVNLVTLVPTGAETIFTTTPTVSITLLIGDAAAVVSNGANWFTF